MSLLLSQTGDVAQYGRKMKANDYRPVPIRWRTVLELHMAGLKCKEIQKETGYSPATIYKILADERMVGLKQQIMSYYDEEFSALFPDVVQAVREGLISKDIGDRLQAAAMWLKAHGKGNGKGGVQNINISAEDVAFNILNQAKGNGT